VSARISGQPPARNDDISSDIKRISNSGDGNYKIFRHLLVRRVQVC
jgi:hypothetical protein